MADLKKLDSTINELEVQVNEFKGFGQVVSEIDELGNKLGNTQKNIDLNKKQLATLSDDVEKQLGDLFKRLDQIDSENREHRIEVSDSLRQGLKELSLMLNDKTDKLSSENVRSQAKFSEDLRQGLVQLNNGLGNKVKEMHEDNKSFQRELDSTLLTRLDKVKSDIQVEIRNEGGQIQRGLENVINAKFNDLEGQIKSFKVLLVVAIILGVISTALSIFL